MIIDSTYFLPLKQRIEYLSEDQQKRVRVAYDVAYEAHLGQFRSSGEPYITHPVAVSTILADLEIDYETLIAALLHDTIEDTEIQYSDIAELFGDSVAQLVEGVSKLDKLKFRNREEAQVENFRKMILAMVEDVRVILIKFADRTHNMRTLGSLRPDKQRRIAKETLEIYVPLAHRLGIHSIKNELETLSFQAMHPLRAAVLSKVIAVAKNKHTDLITKIKQQIEERLQQQNISVIVQPSERSLYQIYQSFVLREQRFQSIMDIYIFDLIVNTIDDCYRTLGYVHTLYKPKSHSFKDYIAIPKTNGYQSLHSSLVGPHGTPVNVHIKTREMDRLSTLGIIADWRSTLSDEEQQTTPQIKALNWLKNLHELQQNAGNSSEFVESVKFELFPKEIYVFTPKGRIIELPAGATAIDFAYELHTDIGNHCISAKINRKPASISTPLLSGQTIAIGMSKEIAVEADWLNVVVTSKARSKIKQILKQMKRNEAIALGRSLLNDQLDSISFDDINFSEHNLFSSININSHDDIYEAVGLGLISHQHVLTLLHHQLNISKLQTEPLIITDNERDLIQLADCCHPIPHDRIMGLADPGQGLLIHHALCHNLSLADPMQRIPAYWQTHESSEFAAEISIIAASQSGDALIHAISIINREKSTLLWLHTEEILPNGRYIIMHLSVNNDKQLAKMMQAIAENSDVITVERNINQCP